MRPFAYLQTPTDKIWRRILTLVYDRGFTWAARTRDHAMTMKHHARGVLVEVKGDAGMLYLYSCPLKDLSEYASGPVIQTNSPEHLVTYMAETVRLARLADAAARLA